MSEVDPLGSVKLELLRRLGPEWRDLAIVCGIPAERLTPGYEAYDILSWLERRRRLRDLPRLLATIGRHDLVDLLDHVAPSRPPVVPDLTTRTLLGRGAPQRTLCSLVTATAAGHSDLVLVEGEPGIGKTALIRHAAAEAADRGCNVFWAACNPLGHLAPLQPLTDALGIPHADRSTDAVLAALTASQPTVLVVDDLQWADKATLFVLGRLAQTIRQHRWLLVIGAMRPVPFRAKLAALRKAAGHTILLSPLADHDVEAFIGQKLNARPSPALLAMASGAAGNPSYLTDLTVALSKDDLLTTTGGYVDLHGGRPPASLAAAIEQRLDFLRPGLRRVLETAVLLGDEFPAPDLATVTGRRMEDLRPYLTEAIRSGLLYDRDGLLAFRHRLVRMALYEHIPQAVRPAAHRDAARALARRAAPIDRVARQLLPVIEASTSDSWTGRWLADSAHQLISQAPSVAIPLLRWELAGKQKNTAPHDELVCRLADALYRVGEAATAEEVAEAALHQVTRADLIVDLLWTIAQCRAAKGRSHETLDRLRGALKTPGIATGHRARLLVLIARVHRSMGDIELACQAADEGLGLATDADDRWAAGWALGVLGLAHGMRGDAAGALPLLDRALTFAADQPALADLRMMLLINRAAALSDLDRYPEAINAVLEVRLLAERADNRIRLAQAESVLAELWFDIGRWDAALRQVETRTRDSADPGVRCSDHGVAALIGLHRGDVAARRHLTDAEPFAQRLGSRLVGSHVLAKALEHEQDGAREEALGVLLTAICTSASEVSEATGLLPDAVRLAVLVRERSHAQRMVDRAEVIGVSDVPHRRAVSYHCRGLLDHDPRSLARAAEQYRRAGRLLPAAQALEAASAAAADPGEARRYRATALSTYRNLRAAWDIARLAQNGRRAA